MLRRLEKGLNNAKLKSQITDSALSQPDLQNGDHKGARVRISELSAADALHYPSDLLPDRGELPYQGHLSGSSSMDEDGDDDPNREEGMYPARLIKRERQRNSFFGTVLGPSGSRAAKEGHSASLSPTGPGRSLYASEVNDCMPSQPALDPPLEDPIQVGLMDEAHARDIFDAVLIRLNPFVNMFDPELHSASYVRRKCAFLFTALLMAGSKFFKPELYPKCRQLAERHAVRAFAEQRKSVEVVQAFMCMTYWKEPDDTVSGHFCSQTCWKLINIRGRGRISAMYVAQILDSSTCAEIICTPRHAGWPWN